jgi:hypothetical protein
MSKSTESKTSKQLYARDLLEPIYIPAVDILTESDRHVEAIDRKIIKLLALLDCYGITDYKHKWFQLSLALAEQHVRGFRVVHEPPRKRGKPRSWKPGLGNAGLGNDLVRDVNSKIGGKKMTRRKAIELLQADRSSRWHRYTVQNLVQREREARRAMKECHRLIAGVGQFPERSSGLTAGFGRIRTDGK